MSLENMNPYSLLTYWPTSPSEITFLSLLSSKLTNPLVKTKKYFSLKKFSQFRLILEANATITGFFFFHWFSCIAVIGSKINPNQIQYLVSSSGGRAPDVSCILLDVLYLCLHIIFSSIAIGYGLPYLLSWNICLSVWYAARQVLFYTPDGTSFLCSMEWLLRIVHRILHCSQCKIILPVNSTNLAFFINVWLILFLSCQFSYSFANCFSWHLDACNSILSGYFLSFTVQQNLIELNEIYMNMKRWLLSPACVNSQM